MSHKTPFSIGKAIRETLNRGVLAELEREIHYTLPGYQPQKQKPMWTETNHFQIRDRTRRTQTEDSKLTAQIEQCPLQECLSRHWLASAVAAWRRTCGHGDGLHQRDLLRQCNLCFTRGCRALLRIG